MKLNEKMKVAICDDEILFLEQLKNKVERCLQGIGIEYEINCYTKAKEVIEASLELDIAFLDIAMPEIDGIIAGEEIQKRNHNCKIIIASSTVDRFKETYKINAMRFITKPYQDNEINEAIMSIVQNTVGMETIELFRERKKYSILQRKIKYIMAYDSYVEIKAGEYFFRKEASLNEMERYLDDKIFFRVHKQFLINFLWIGKYENDIIFIEDKEISIARRKRKDFSLKYMEFDVNYR